MMVTITKLKISRQTIERFAPKMLALISVALNGISIATTVKATAKSIREIEDIRKDHEPSKKEILSTVGKNAIVPSVAFVAAQAATIGSAVLSEEQILALGTALGAAEYRLQQYRGAANNVYGDQADAMITSKIVHDSGCMDIRPECEGTKELFYDAYRFGEMSDVDRPASDGLFECDLDTFRDARYELNVWFAKNGCVDLNDFYSLLHIPTTVSGHEYVWDAANGIECIEIDLRPLNFDVSGGEVWEIIYKTRPENWYDDPRHW